jgi:hypothetical protein
MGPGRSANFGETTKANFVKKEKPPDRDKSS